MKTQNELLIDLQLNTEAEKFKFENLFKGSDKTLDEFLKAYYPEIRSVYAKHSTNTLHLGFLSNIKNEEFINEVIKSNLENVYTLLNELKEIEKKK